MAADALAVYITKPLAAMVLTMIDKQLANTHLCFLKMIQHLES